MITKIHKTGSDMEPLPFGAVITIAFVFVIYLAVSEFRMRRKLYVDELRYQLYALRDELVDWIVDGKPKCSSFECRRLYALINITLGKSEDMTCRTIITTLPQYEKELCEAIQSGSKEARQWVLKYLYTTLKFIATNNIIISLLFVSFVTGEQKLRRLMDSDIIRCLWSAGNTYKTYGGIS